MFTYLRSTTFLRRFLISDLQSAKIYCLESLMDMDVFGKRQELCWNWWLCWWIKKKQLLTPERESKERPINITNSFNHGQNWQAQVSEIYNNSVPGPRNIARDDRNRHQLLSVYYHLINNLSSLLLIFYISLTGYKQISRVHVTNIFTTV